MQSQLSFLESGNKIRKMKKERRSEKSEGDRTKKGTGGRSRNWMEIKKVGHSMKNQERRGKVFSRREVAHLECFLTVNLDCDDGVAFSKKVSNPTVW